MDAASPLIFLLLAVVLVIAAAESASTASGFPSASGIITYVFAGILAVIGGATLLYRRMQEGEGDDGVNSWADVLRGAVGPGVAAVVGNLLKHGIWVLVLITTVLLTMYLTMDTGVVTGSLLSPLAWIGFALVGVLGVAALLLSPAVGAMRGTGRLGDVLDWLAKQASSPRVLGYLILAVLVTALLALGRVYPMVGGVGVVLLVLYGVVHFGERLIPKEWTDAIEQWFSGAAKQTPIGPKTLASFLQEQKHKDRNLMLSTVVISGLIVAFAVGLPYLWKHLPSVRVLGNIGKVLVDEATPLSTPVSKAVPELGGWESGLTGGYGMSHGGGTSNYTVAWWQFINSRPRAQEATALELGPVGHLQLGPGPNTAVLALTSPSPSGAVEQVRLPIKLQKWQQVVLRASGNRTDVFVDGQLVGTSQHPPASLRQGDIFTIPGTLPKETQGGIAKLTFSPKAEPYSAIVLSYRSPPSAIAKEG